jgi:AcrR family transcriptional regulator
MMKNVNHLTHRQRQALATRKLIADTASQLFLERGYVATTIEAIAAQAGVAISTVYSVFSNKRGILAEIRQQWHDESQAKSIYDEAATQTDPARFLELLAHGSRRQWETGANMIAIYQSAAAADTEAADELAAALHGRHANMLRIVESMYPRLRQDWTLQQTSAIVLALTLAEVYRELVEIAGWMPDAYEQWLSQTLKQQLLANRES